jgi:hypothetical protein
MSKKNKPGPDETTKSNTKQCGNRNDGRMFTHSDIFINTQIAKPVTTHSLMSIVWCWLTM